VISLIVYNKFGRKSTGRKKKIQTMEQFGSRVAKLRVGMRMSKKSFAEMIGVSAQYLGKVESGEHGFTLDTLAALCERTGVSADYLLFGRDSSLRAAVPDTRRFQNDNKRNESLIQEIFKYRTDDAAAARPAI